MDTVPTNGQKAIQWHVLEDMFNQRAIQNIPPLNVNNAKAFCTIVLRYAAMQNYGFMDVQEFLEEIGFTEEYWGQFTLEMYQAVKVFPQINDFYGILQMSVIANEDFVQVIAINIKNSELHPKWLVETKKWLIWNGRYYVFDDKYVMEGKIRQEIVKYRRVRTRDVYEILNHLRTLDNICINYTDLDPQTNLISCENGVFNAETNLLESANPLYLSFTVLPQHFFRNLERPIGFTAFLEKLQWSENQEIALLSCMKYALLNQQWLYKKVLMLYGVPNSGKSLVCRLLWRMMGSQYTHWVTPLSQLEDPHAAGNLPGKVLVVIDDAQSNYLSQEAYNTIKNWSSKTPILANPKGRDMFNILPKFSLWITCNKLFKLPSNIDIKSLQQRFILFEFTESYENDPETEKILNEEIPAIFNYILSFNAQNIDSFIMATPEDFVKVWNKSAELVENLIFDELDIDNDLERIFVLVKSKMDKAGVFETERNLRHTIRECCKMRKMVSNESHNNNYNPIKKWQDYAK